MSIRSGARVCLVPSKHRTARASGQPRKEPYKLTTARLLRYTGNAPRAVETPPPRLSLKRLILNGRYEHLHLGCHCERLKRLILELSTFKVEKITAHFFAEARSVGERAEGRLLEARWDFFYLTTRRFQTFKVTVCALFSSFGWDGMGGMGWNRGMEGVLSV
jgi:hypothetical protein